METDKLRHNIINRWSALQRERESYLPHWKEISEFIAPNSGIFTLLDSGKGGKKHKSIYDNTASRSLRTLAAGMMAGMTSPSRPWFRLSTSSPELDESSGVKIWLADVTRIMQQVFSRSNTYRALHSIYSELGAFGTGCSIILADFDTVVHHYPLTIGSFALASNSKGQVDTMYREFMMTAAQMVSEFGYENCSQQVKSAFDGQGKDDEFAVLHAIEPRNLRDTTKKDSKSMKWRSVYLEQGTNEGKMLRESGFNKFPVIAPRWEVSPNRVYGYSPGMEALGDIIQLQHEQVRKAQGIDYKTKPPLVAPTSSKNEEFNMLPGGVTYADAIGQSAGIRSAFEVNVDLSHLLEDIHDVRERIKSSFYTDLLLMISQADIRGMTATEVGERHEEKMLMLGPVLERMHNEILDPIIDITFTHMSEAGILPPAPEELQGKELVVEFVSVLAQAQRAVTNNAVDKLVISIGSVAQFKPEVLDRFDADKWVDEYADALGVNPELIVPLDQANILRQQRAQAIQAQQQAAQMEQAAAVAQKLGTVQTEQPNMASDMMSQFSQL